MIVLHIAVTWSVLNLASTQSPQYIDCKYMSSCSCLADKGVIDLSPLDSGDPSSPRFSVSGDDDDSIAYLYNPCTALTMGTNTDCNQVAVCQDDTEHNVLYNLGYQESVVFINNSERGLELRTSGYSGDGRTRVAHIQLICDESEDGTLDAKGQDTSSGLHFIMTLTSKHCCPIATTAFPETTTLKHTTHSSIINRTSPNAETTSQTINPTNRFISADELFIIVLVLGVIIVLLVIVFSIFGAIMCYKRCRKEPDGLLQAQDQQ